MCIRDSFSTGHGAPGTGNRRAPLQGVPTRPLCRAPLQECHGIGDAQMRSAAVLVVALAVGCQASPPTSPDATPDSVPITIAQISQPPSGLLSPGAVLAPNTQVRIGGSYFLTEPDLQSIRRTVWVYACPGHDAASFRTFCSGEGQKPTLGRTLFTADLAYPGMPLDIQFIHILLIE